MKRSGPPARKTPIKRTAMKRSSRSKSTPARAAANGENCTLRLDGCLWTNAVLCHLRTKGAAGAGQKPPDWHAVFGCAHCHDVIDGRDQSWHAPGLSIALGLQRALDIATAIIRALFETHRILEERGILRMKG